jgi:hypothetical protein
VEQKVLYYETRHFPSWDVAGLTVFPFDRIGEIQRSQHQILSLAGALSRSLRNTNGGVIMNSPASDT